MVETKRPFGVSLEVIESILRYLNPIHIICVRKTCRQLYEATKARSVWLAALDQVCEQHGIFKPSFPTEKMSLVDLEHAALSPYRLARAIKTFQPDAVGSNAVPRQSRIPLLRKAGPNPDIRYDVDILFLVPGGRFLVTSGRLRPGVCLWDLGYNAFVHIRSTPIAILEGAHVEAVCPSSDGRQLTIAVSEVSSPIHHYTRIYQIDPGAPNPTFDLRGEIDTNSATIQGVLFTQDTAYVICGGDVVVWNWIENKGCMWRTNFVSARSVYVCDESIFICDSEPQISVWDRPQLSPITTPNLNQLPIVSSRPKCILQLPIVDPELFHFSGTPVWQLGVSPDRNLCVLADSDEVVYSLSLYSIRHIPGQDPFLPNALPVMGGRSLSAYGEDTADAYAFSEAPSGLFYCDGHLVMCSYTDHHSLIATVLPIPTEASQGDVEPRSMPLMPHGDDEGPITDQQYAFCPMSGRLVHRWHRELRVSDFLAPPEEA